MLGCCVWSAAATVLECIMSAEEAQAPAANMQ